MKDQLTCYSCVYSRFSMTECRHSLMVQQSENDKRFAIPVDNFGCNLHSELEDGKSYELVGYEESD